MAKINGKNAEVLLQERPTKRIILTPAQCVELRKNFKKIMEPGRVASITTNDLVIEFVVENK